MCGVCINTMNGIDIIRPCTAAPPPAKTMEEQGQPSNVWRELQNRTYSTAQLSQAWLLFEVSFMIDLY